MAEAVAARMDPLVAPIAQHVHFLAFFFHRLLANWASVVFLLLLLLALLVAVLFFFLCRWHRPSWDRRISSVRLIPLIFFNPSSILLLIFFLLQLFPITSAFLFGLDRFKFWNIFIEILQLVFILLNFFFISGHILLCGFWFIKLFLAILVQLEFSPFSSADRRDWNMIPVRIGDIVISSVAVLSSDISLDEVLRARIRFASLTEPFALWNVMK